MVIAICAIFWVKTPHSDGFVRREVYTADGYRPAGYYVVRQDSARNGYINITHPENSRIFYIETYNIQNLTLNFEEMYIQRNFLFGWVNVTWYDAVSTLDVIDIYINTSDGIDSLTFREYPDVQFSVYVDDELYTNYTESAGEIGTDIPLPPGDYDVTIKVIRTPITVYGILVNLLYVIVVLSLGYIIIKWTRAIFEDESKTGGE